MLKVLIVSSEVAPFAKSGGLGDVVGSLPKELLEFGLDVRVILPKYKNIKNINDNTLRYIGSVTVCHNNVSHVMHIKMLDDVVKTYFVENDYFFGRDNFYGYDDDAIRFSVFSDAIIMFLNSIDHEVDIIHLNDWQTALVALYLKKKYNKFYFYKKIKTLFTIHNLQYQGVFDKSVLHQIGLDESYFVASKLEFYDKISFLKAGLVYSDKINTVSPTYADEIKTPKFGYGLDGVLNQRHQDLFGILNGIDMNTFDPSKDIHIFKNYNIDTIVYKKENKFALQKYLNLPIKDVPIFSIVSRFADQKGFDILVPIFEQFLSKDIQLILLGTGDEIRENFFKHMSRVYPEKLSCNIFFSVDLAQKIYAASDMFLMPSLFEPCGLSQMISMKYGTIPIARNTGGLSDTITHFDYTSKQGNGILFNDYLPSALLWAIEESLRLYNDKDNFNLVVQNAMQSDFSWKKSALLYLDLYKKL